MSLLVTTFLATTVAAAPSCSWDRPGMNRYTGDIVAAVAHYADIPGPVRRRLQQRIAARDFDEVVEIRRDRIVGRHEYAPELRDMHFGSRQICRTTTRENWPASAVERGMVYCEDEHCLVVPTVCGNLSRLTRLRTAGGGGTGGSGGTQGEVMGVRGEIAAGGGPAEGLASGAADSLPPIPETPGPVAVDGGGRTFEQLAGRSEAGPQGGSTSTSGPVASAGQPPLVPGEAPSRQPTLGADGVHISSGPFAPIFADPGPGSLPLPPLPAVPEPGTGLLGLLGIAGLWARGRWRRRAACRGR